MAFGAFDIATAEKFSELGSALLVDVESDYVAVVSLFGIDADTAAGEVRKVEFLAVSVVGVVSVFKSGVF
jgi:hypothetical protein